MHGLPTGTVTFLFTDLETQTALESSFYDQLQFLHDRPSEPAALSSGTSLNDAGTSCPIGPSRPAGQVSTNSRRADLFSITGGGAVCPSVEVRRLDTMLRQRHLDLCSVLHTVLGGVCQEEAGREAEDATLVGKVDRSVVVQVLGELNKLIRGLASEIHKDVEPRPGAPTAEFVLVLSAAQTERERLLAADHMQQQLPHGS